MARREQGWLRQIAHRRSLRRWTRIARHSDVAELSDLRIQQSRARVLKARLDDLIAVADSRLALPRIGSSALPRPPGTDWSWRPSAWRSPMPNKGLVAAESRTPLGEGTMLFHDCRISELTLRQVRNTRERDLAPFGLRMDVFRFDGSFLSLVLELPAAAAEGLKRRHLVRLDLIAEIEKPLEIFARLNIKHGPNVEQIVRELPLNAGEVFVEFDMAYTELDEKRVERMWLDLIFEGPEMNQVTIRDVTLARYPRAEILRNPPMADTELTRTRIIEGVWEGVLTHAGPDTWQPRLGVTHLGEEVAGLEVQESGPGVWTLRLPIPVQLISDGVQTFVIRDLDRGDTLESFCLVAGEPLIGDLRAEIGLLRAELDLLKRAFRRHCIESA